MTIAVAMPHDQSSAQGIGISHEGRTAIAEQLKLVLANSIVLRMRVQHVHWNIEGVLFKGVHELTEQQYLELDPAIDDIAERIRALDVAAPGRLRDVLNLSDISEDNDQMDAASLLNEILEALDRTRQAIRNAFRVAEQHGDQVTCDMMIKRAAVHDKDAWMLRSLARGLSHGG